MGREADDAVSSSRRSERRSRSREGRRRSRERRQRDKRRRSRHRSRSDSRERTKSRRERRRSSRSRSRDASRSRSPSRRTDDRKRTATEQTGAAAAAGQAPVPPPLLGGDDSAELSTRDLEIELEQQRIEDEMRKRRERVEAWRREKAAKEAAAVASSASPTPAGVDDASRGATPAESNDGDADRRGDSWNLEDDSDDDEPESATAQVHDASDSMDTDDFVLRPLVKREQEEDDGDKMLVDVAAPAEAKPSSVQVAEEQPEDDDVDPLEAYMTGVHREVKQLVEQDRARAAQLSGKPVSAKARALDAAATNGAALPAGAASSLFEEDEDFAEEEAGKAETEEDILAIAMKKAKRKDLPLVDHEKIEYESFRRNFYIEAEEIKNMTAEEVAIYRGELEGIKIRGADCPNPIKTWAQCGLNAKILDIIKRNNFKTPTPIQAQALPAVMSGRDVIGIARTGSGKTLAYLLPMFRHILDQRPVEDTEGPIALIMVPTRELGIQVYNEVRRFAKVLDLRCVCVYGGASLSEQIADMKRGAEIVVCTPGRMINLLVANQGRVTNLQRVTFLVLDEADRMFDMGFEPQVMRMIQNTRPDRQTVLFSATFPRAMEALARRVLKNPVEIQVGGRSIVPPNITQHVELMPEEHKLLRLLQLLGEKYDESKRILIFVDRQDAADSLFKQLLEKGYMTLVIHGGKDQGDRDQTLADFKNGVGTVMVATSVLARGLDVRQLAIVVNYDCPNHYEDYVHRCGRTGRAGNTGDAYTFVTPEQGKYAGDLVKALSLSSQPVPAELEQLCNTFREQVEKGAARHHGSGFGGKGLERIEWGRASVIQSQMKEYLDEDTTGERPAAPNAAAAAGGSGDSATKTEELAMKIIKEVQAREASPAPPESPAPAVPAPPTAPAASAAAPSAVDLAKAAAIAKANALTQEALRAAAARGKGALPPGAAAALSQLNAKLAGSAAGGSAPVAAGPVPQGVVVRAPPGSVTAPYFAELEINDYPQAARWKVTSKESMVQLTEETGASLTTRGTFVAPGAKLRDGDRKLYVLIEGGTEQNVQHALEEVKRLLTEGTVQAIERGQLQPSLASGGRYQVLSLEYKK